MTLGVEISDADPSVGDQRPLGWWDARSHPCCGALGWGECCWACEGVELVRRVCAP